MTDSCKYRFLFYTKKNPQAYLPKVFPKVNKTALLSWQIHVQKYPEEVEKNWLKTYVFEKNAESMQKLF